MERRWRGEHNLHEIPHVKFIFHTSIRKIILFYYFKKTFYSSNIEKIFFSVPNKSNPQREVIIKHEDNFRMMWERNLF